MPLFSDMEKEILQNALTVFLQLNQQRMPAADFEKLYRLIQPLIEKIETAEEGGAGAGAEAKPRGISDEWYQSCCRACDKLAPGGRCLDKITEKYPGKCDPVLKYEREKLLKKQVPAQ